MSRLSNTEARVRELNHARRLLVARHKELQGTCAGNLCYGIQEAIRVLMEHKKEIRAAQASDAAALREELGRALANETVELRKKHEP